MGRKRKVAFDPDHSRWQATVIEKYRVQLPLGKFLHSLTSVALTGQLPNYDSQGNLTGSSTEVPVDWRIKTTEYLVDKVMPNKMEAPPAPNIDHIDQPGAIHKLSNDELRSLVAGTLTELKDRTMAEIEEESNG